MNGIHDLGGMHGFGRVPVEAGAAYHAAWELRVAAIMLRLLRRGVYNIDAFRHGIERMAPARYLSASYFERWRTSVETNLAESGALLAGEIERRLDTLRGERPAPPARAIPTGVAMPPPARASFVRDVPTPPRFASGDTVRTRNLNPPGHTRLPRYVRGRRGQIERAYPGFVFPDTNAHGLGESPQYLYNVRFEGRELWGPDAEPNSCVRIDLFESYLMRADEDER